MNKDAHYNTISYSKKTENYWIKRNWLTKLMISPTKNAIQHLKITQKDIQDTLLGE